MYPTIQRTICVTFLKPFWKQSKKWILGYVSEKVININEVVERVI
jgi:hypothetical protein